MKSVVVYVFRELSFMVHIFSRVSSSVGTKIPKYLGLQLAEPFLNDNEKRTVVCRNHLGGDYLDRWIKNNFVSKFLNFMESFLYTNEKFNAKYLMCTLFMICVGDKACLIQHFLANLINAVNYFLLQKFTLEVMMFCSLIFEMICIWKLFFISFGVF